MDDAADLGKRFAISPLLDLEIDAAGAGWAGITADADHDLRLSVTAAIVARLMGYKSIDRVRKILEADAAVHQSRDVELREACGLHLYHYDHFYRSLSPRVNERIGIFAFDLAMIRSRSSVELMMVTARQGFLIEPCLISRALMEQFAYALSVWETDDPDLVMSTKPQSVIKSLSKVNSKAGRAYGLLSKLAHYDPRMHYSFIGDAKTGNPDEQLLFTQRSWKFKIISAAWTFFTLDLMFRVFEACYGRHENFDRLGKLSGTLLVAFDGYFTGVEEKAVRDVRELIAAA